MSTLNPTSTLDIDRRRAPRLGAFNATLLGLELKRMLRNKRTVFFTLLFPGLMLLAVASGNGWEEKVGSGNVGGYIMVSMALYGASLTAASAGAMVALERALGWSRQLRLTPLNPIAYIAVKVLVALALGAVAIVVVNAVGIAQGHAAMPVGVWIACALLALLCTLVFAALGVFVGYLVPGENAMQFLGPGLAVMAFVGDVFLPITHGSAMWHIASFTPMFGVAQIVRAPMTHFLPWYAIANAVLWFVLFTAGAAWRMSRDSARV